jgi:RimJ/RimL family protein N-acetyltransferase
MIAGKGGFHSVKLVNERVALLPLGLEYYEALLPFSIYEPELWMYALQSAASPEQLWQYIIDAGNACAEGKAIPFVIVDKETHRVAGSTRFYDIDISRRQVRIGYSWLGGAFHGTGLNKICKRLMLDYAFRVLKMDHVELRVDCRNLKSIRAVQKLGAILQYTERQYCKEEKMVIREVLGFNISRAYWESGLDGSLILHTPALECATTQIISI